MSNRHCRLILPAVLAAMTTISPAKAGDDRPWAEVRVGGIADDERKEEDVLLVAINGSRDIGTTSVYELQPGMQYLRIASKKRGKSGELTSQPYALQMQPCIRYALVADHGRPLDNRSWQVAVKSETPIKACVKKYGDRQATGDAAP